MIKTFAAKGVKIVLGCLIGAASFTGIVVFASVYAEPEKLEYRYLDDIEIRSISDSPPISESSIFYSGKEYTPPSQRGLISLLNPEGTKITDKKLNNYFIGGSESVEFRHAALYVSNNGRYRICNRDNHDECVSVSSVIEYRDSLKKLVGK